MNQTSIVYGSGQLVTWDHNMENGECVNENLLAVVESYEAKSKSYKVHYLPNQRQGKIPVDRIVPLIKVYKVAEIAQG